MKKEFKGFICGVLATAVVGLGVVSASGVWDNISVLRNDINVVVNGRDVTADNFLYNDTTYLPLRAVSEALNQSVSYDESTNTAYIGMGSPNQTVSNTNTEEAKVGYEYKYSANSGSKIQFRDALEAEGFEMAWESNTEIVIYNKGNYRVTISDDETRRFLFITAVEMK